ncbi:MAG: ComEC family competence protein [Bacteroidia bacterium]|nr:ComEC family competence protein [Bacteroidia bacterium]MCX7763820.1 ComEC family competence protein [Bacteroidia bacterium]MDW8056654.1 ComEC/Rec2 family competence protein [Bacteroidia bacterium]
MPAWRYPFVWAAAGMILGILLAEISGKGALLIWGGIVGGSAYAWFRLQWGRLVWSLPLFAFLGWVRAWVEKLPPPNALSTFTGHLVRLSGYVIEEPFRTKRAYRLLLRVDSVYLYRLRQLFPTEGRLLLYVRDSSVMTIPVGTRIYASCRLDSIRFGADYWARQKVFVSAFSEEVEKGKIEPLYLFGYFQRLRQAIIAKMESTSPLSGAPLAVAQALLLGYKRGIEPEVRETFQLSGAAHILAVSGMHVGLVLSVWLFLLSKLPAGWGRHWVSQSLLLVVVVMYGFLTGASPSAMRAVIMGSVAIAARMLQQLYLPLNALGFAAFLQSAAEPNVIYELGFQLSYAAVGGIMAFYEPIRTFLLRRSKKESLFFSYLKDITAVSLAAQGGTLFLSWAYFGRFPIYFLLANLIAVPLATALAFSAVAWVGLMYVPGVAEIVGYPPYAFAWLLVKSVQLISALPGGSLSLPAIPPYLGVFLTLITIVAVGVWLHHRLKEAKTPWLI